ncbi:TonB-dependent siderophore receptor [Caballeronia sordidicola]|uniref:TonB-dependent siderophore receptor n=1 Tax=Caballeronia sordidicola TaxID=196367 RepID=A0A158FWX8_CABSO|nr:TonB-dependent siderophore receptor [Caballeronia sordidicola]SAL23660.1 TonB-dependent siderophore receptor [Caballeronia sordidicola]
MSHRRHRKTLSPFLHKRLVSAPLGAIVLGLRGVPAALVFAGLAAAPAGYAAGVADVAASTPASAQKTYAVPAGSLGGALAEFASQAGVTVQLDSRLVDGMRSQGIKGSFTPREGFSTLLSGTGLEIVESSPGIFLVRPAPARSSADVVVPDASTLPAVKVSANAGKDGADSLPVGYVATHSSSALKSDASILETPVSVSVVTRDQMTQQNAQTLNAAVRYTSGVTPETRGGVATRYDLLTVRGFDADTYWNGLKLLGNGQYAVPQMDTYLMDRIEVLKGPVSVLYGQAAAGGVLDQESKMPTRVPLHELGVEFGNYGHKQATFDFSGPLDADSRYLYRLTGIARAEDGQVNTTRNERIAIAPSFTWRPDDKTSLTLMALYQRDPRSTSYGSVPPQGSSLPSPFGPLPSDFYDGDAGFERFSRTQESVGYKFERKLDPNWTVRSNGRYFHLGQDYASVYGSGLEADNRTLDRYSIGSTDQLNTIALDNQIEGKFSTGSLKHTVLAGFDYQHVAGTSALGYGSAPALDILAPDYYQAIPDFARTVTQIRNNQYGLYAQDQMRMGHVVLTLGAREDWSNTSTRDVTDNTLIKQSARAFTKRAGLSYVFDSGIAPYASYTESFSPQIGTDAGGKPFDPERARQYEIGVKFQPANYDALLTLALFDVKRKNLLTPDGNNPNFQSQVGESRSRGVEIEAKANLTDSLNLTASYTYIDAKYLKDNSGLEGKHLASVPANQASAWAYYTQHRGPFAGLSAGAGVRYTGQTYSYDNDYKLSSFVLVDATLRYDLGHIAPRLKGSEIYVNAQNLLNKRYVASCYYTTWCAFGYGRQVFAGANYRW